ncbi:hypothetical protein HU200_066941 [Digitaria exilis]|uniref:Uncharacterized protein n=1 Tax=Digitaria exilis TaxID=1010633 RepID=A0A835A094_9POAL|nr:hypothetical protein HU200_066941 [Digitaria exilis]
MTCCLRPSFYGRSCALALLICTAVFFPGLLSGAHCFGIRAGFDSSLFFYNTLFDAYSQHGLVAPAR